MKNPPRAAITTHILDLDNGSPAAGIEVKLIAPSSKVITTATSNENGRIDQWANDFSLTEGIWQLIFCVEDWFKIKDKTSFFSDINIAFKTTVGQAHYHVPLLLNAYGYTTYRGS